MFDGGAELELGGTEDRGAALAAAIRDRGDARILDALEAFIGTRGPFAPDRSARFRKQLELIAATPALRTYARRQWVDCADAVVSAIAETTTIPADDVALRAAVRYVLETPSIVGGHDEPRAALATIFDRLRAGWPEL